MIDRNLVPLASWRQAHNLVFPDHIDDCPKLIDEVTVVFSGRARHDFLCTRPGASAVLAFAKNNAISNAIHHSSISTIGIRKGFTSGDHPQHWRT